jgi:hypothetical protein
MSAMTPTSNSPANEIEKTLSQTKVIQIPQVYAWKPGKGVEPTPKGDFSRNSPFFPYSEGSEASLLAAVACTHLGMETQRLEPRIRQVSTNGWQRTFSFLGAL